MCVTFGNRYVRVEILESAADGMWWNNCRLNEGEFSFRPSRLHVFAGFMYCASSEVLANSWLRIQVCRVVALRRWMAGWLLTSRTVNCRGCIFKEPDKNIH
jgi:hypothetical protein